MQEKANFMPRRDFAVSLNMELGKIHTCQLGYDTRVVKKYFNFSTFAQLLSESNILIGLIRCFYERLMLLAIFAARLICINLEFDIVFPVIKSFKFWS